MGKLQNRRDDNKKWQEDFNARGIDDPPCRAIDGDIYIEDTGTGRIVSYGRPTSTWKSKRHLPAWDDRVEIAWAQVRKNELWRDAEQGRLDQIDHYQAKGE